MDVQIHLADGFPAATRDQWLALVANTLKGAGIEALDRTTSDGLTVHALYDAQSLGEEATPRPQRAGPGWDIRAAIAEPDPAQAHALILEALAGGATSVLIAIEARGHAGVRVADAEDFARLVQGVLTDIAPVALDAGPLALTAGGWLDAVAKASPAAPLAFHLDPISAFAKSGACPGGIANRIEATARTAARLAETYPRASLLQASGRVVHESGGTPAEELAFAAAAALTYARALVNAGLGMDQAWARTSLGLAVEAEPLAAIAKLRAARLIWTRLTGACGVDAAAVIEARSSERMLTRADPWTNLVRLTCAGFAAGVGGADAVVLGTHGDALGLTADSAALRLARNTQIILMEEAHLGRVADPAGGAWALEALTLDLARTAWSRFTALEAQGGLVGTLQSGTIAADVARSRTALAAALAKGERRIVGVTDFPPAERPPTAANTPPGPGEAAHDPPGLEPDSACPPLTPIHLEDLIG